MPKNNYDHLFPKISDYEKDQLRRIILEDSKNLDSNVPYKIKYEEWERQKIDPANTVFSGPWTAKEFLAKLGIDLDNLGTYNDSSYGEVAYKRKNVLEAFARYPGVLHLGLESTNNKVNAGVINTVHFCEEANKRMDELSKPEGEYTLTLWDKFWGFFGYKTEHALAVEKERTCLEVYKAKQHELSKQFALEAWESEADLVAEEEKSMSRVINAAKANAKEKLEAWNKVFFGEEKVSPYTLKNGKQISAVSLCLAALQQRIKGELSSMQPDEVLKNMANDSKYAENIKKIGDKIKDMVEMKKSAVKLDPKFKQLDKFLFEKGNDGLSVSDSVDRQLKEYIKPADAKGRPFALDVAADYNKIGWSKDKENMFGSAAVVLKAKDEMRALFGKNDPVFGVKYKEAEADMEKNIRDVIKSVELTQALENKNYDAVLKAEGFGNDYNKLGDAIKANLNKFYVINNELLSGKKLEAVNKADLNKVNNEPEAENDGRDMS